MDIVYTTKDNILKAANKSNEYKKLLEELYPEVFEDDKFLCTIGSIFSREEHPKNIYCIIKIQGKVKILNITQSSFWDEERAIKVEQLKDLNKRNITVGEFKKISGKNDLSRFRFEYNLSFNP